MYYFGCVGQAGHHLFDQTLRMLGRMPHGFPFSHVDMLDGGFFPCGMKSDGPEGVVLSWRNPDWAIFSFLDRSVDKRPGSNSSFIVKIEDDEKAEETLLRACKAFPSIVTRFTFPLMLYGVQVWPVKENPNKLLPCPFCGGEAELSDYQSQHPEKEQWFAGAVAKCVKCQAFIRAELPLPSGVRDGATSASVIEAARHSWNRRAVK